MLTPQMLQRALVELADAAAAADKDSTNSTYMIVKNSFEVGQQ